MKTVLAIRHMHFEDLGSFEDAFRDRGYQVRTCDVGVDELAGIDPLAPDILATLGGPIGVYEDNRYPFIKDELRILRQRLDAKRPTLGFCLGAQMMAGALGARVYPGPRKEIGWAPITLTPEGQSGPLRHLENVPVLHWHGDTFDLPAGAKLLASTPITQNQAFSLGPNVLALQFHMEAEPKGLERWLIGHTGEIAQTGLDVRKLRADIARQGPAVVEAGAAAFNRWLDGIAEV
jgi:GMP synthase (glutamine-hydrolysing)